MKLSQSLPNQVNDFNNSATMNCSRDGWSVAIPSKPGQRLQSAIDLCTRGGIVVAIPSKPGQRLQSAWGRSTRLPHAPCRNPFQTRSTTSIRVGERVFSHRLPLSQSLPNQVNDFNEGQSVKLGLRIFLSQSLPNQVNDFNRASRVRATTRASCRNPFQTRSTTSMPKKPARPAGRPVSQSLPNQVNDFNLLPIPTPEGLEGCRNPFQTRSTTSMFVTGYTLEPSAKESQSLPNQVNDFNSRF